MESLAAALRSVLRGAVRVAEPMSRHTTWRIGGPADLYLEPLDADELVTALRMLEDAGQPWLALGAGSNLLVRDGGWRGAILCLKRLRRAQWLTDGSLRAEAGLPLMNVIRNAAVRGWAGLEQLAGIPATLGGAVAMNAGAGGQDMAGVLRQVVLAGPEGLEEWPVERLDLGYRHASLPAGRVVALAQLQFAPGEPSALETAVRRRLEQRRQAQGVGRPNAGSVFKNPAPELPAWRLIEAAGMRGARVGQAQVADKHANFIINQGGATAGEVLDLIGRIQRAVQSRADILLEPEVRVIGTD
ncbi:UDP-N-acetylmuramate dehydrogenase [Desulfuromonas sp. CSMB_57]|uniref:UDP-N-acetylmuramate dehydrogenase n=1 Tax=Desulfuromonas sp. CSMB_57 TaxID=2807629 RepID=UPI001CD5E126